jgi:oxygen-independent coproporphyrinogen-3 oxidase
MRSGIPRISADFIFGLPGQSPDDAQRQAIELSDFGVTHLSCYQLTIEPGTRFGDLARRGSLTLADDGEVAESFLAVDEGLTSRGLRHYEVSNYAREGDQCRHNLGYWRGDEYLGLGCGAVGYARTNAFGDPVTGVRWRNTDSPRDYLQRAASDDTELLDAETLLRERIMLGLRVDSGVDLDDAASELGVVGWTSARSSCAAALVKRGRIVRQGSRIHIPKREWLWTDRIAADLI